MSDKLPIWYKKSFFSLLFVANALYLGCINPFSTKQPFVRLSHVSDLSCRIVDCYRLIAENNMKLGNKDDAIAFLVMANQRMDTLCSVNMQRLMHERSMLANIQRKEALAEARQKEIAGQRRMLFPLGGCGLCARSGAGRHCGCAA